MITLVVVLSAVFATVFGLSGDDSVQNRFVRPLSELKLVSDRDDDLLEVYTVGDFAAFNFNQNRTHTVAFYELEKIVHPGGKPAPISYIAWLNTTNYTISGARQASDSFITFSSKEGVFIRAMIAPDSPFEV